MKYQSIIDSYLHLAIFPQPISYILPSLTLLQDQGHLLFIFAFKFYNSTVV